MKNSYRINFAANTLIMSKAFEEAAHDPFSDEYKILQKIRSDFPGLVISRKTRRPSKKARPNKNMSYDNMLKYMSVYENADALVAQFELVRVQSQKAASPYSYVLAWFNRQFPNHKDILEKSKEKAKIIPLPAVKIVELFPASGE
ncbi:MAG: hypothetical protein ACOX7G_05870 [Candidatus Scatomorpha sp.]|jgi:hypothetical protein